MGTGAGGNFVNINNKSSIRGTRNVVYMDTEKSGTSHRAEVPLRYLKE